MGNKNSKYWPATQQISFKNLFKKTIISEICYCMCMLVCPLVNVQNILQTTGDSFQILETYEYSKDLSVCISS